VEGASPAKETVAFVESMANVQGKKAILFCTYKAFGNERTMKKIEKMLEPKGCQTILKVSKKGMKPEKESGFSDLIRSKKGFGKAASVIRGFLYFLFVLFL